MMDINLVKEIIACLPKERTLFHYFKDRYAQILLYHFIENEMDIKEIKNSHMAGLLQKPVMRHFLASNGNGKLRRNELRHCWQTDMYYFVLTLGYWGGARNRGWYQTSRKGYNLVLQLNFSNVHDAAYNSLVRPRADNILNYYAHPFNKKSRSGHSRETLAWARIDLDFRTNEALIEEIQSDWVRRVKSLLNNARYSARNGHHRCASRWNVEGNLKDIVEYCEGIFQPYEKIWSEAMLGATIDFIRHELGINTIYYHTDSTGFRVKKIRNTHPPKSIYDKLPRQFCFTKIKQAPVFLNQDRSFYRAYRKIKNPEWFQLQL